MKNTMTSSADRMRLKDKIITNVARAIKGIHEYQLCTGESEVVLTNNTWHCHRLCEHLDHAFLHGLRHITHGYWKLVTEFTRKEAVKEIKHLQRITTDLGRGRAWLFLALNENLLESYMRCFLENTSVVKKYYVREALVLDQQRMNVLVTLTSGLDFASFQLEYDLPYLDLNASPPKSKPQSDAASAEDEDKVSLCSMESFASRNSLSAISSSMIESTVTATDSDCGSVNSDNGSLNNSFHLPKLYHVGSLDSGYYCGVDSSTSHRQSRGSLTMSDSMSLSSISSNTEDCRFRRIENVLPNSHVDGENNLEVIHVKSKVLKRKKREQPRMKKDAIGKNHLANTDNATLVKTNATTTNRTRAATITAATSLRTTPRNISVITTKPTPVSKSNPMLSVPEKDTFSNSYSKAVKNNKVLQKKAVVNNQKKSEKQNDVILDNKTSCEEKKGDQLISSVILNGKPVDIVDKKEEILTDSSPSETVISDQLPKDGDEDTKENKDSSEAEEVEESEGSTEGCVDVAEVTSLGGYNADCSSSCEDKTRASSCDLIVTNSAQKPSVEDEEEDIYCKTDSADRHSSSVPCRKQVFSDIFPVDEDVHLRKMYPRHDADSLQDNTLQPDPGQVMIDNHILLYLMLEIFEENEKFLKMFVTREGQNEGQTTHVFVVITAQSIYLLKQNTGDQKFIKESSIPFHELDYISLSVNSQVINIVCANRRRKFWLTTGDEEVSRSIINCLSHAMETSFFNIPKLSVLTDATSQQIAMKKYISQETKSSMYDVELHSYQLIHWEDAQLSCNQGEWTYKEGYLLHRYHDYFRGFMWKPGYFVLKDGALCMYNNKTDSKPSAFINMGIEDCTGCRRATDSDRENTIEIMLTNGDYWYIAAATPLEANEWQQSFCQAASEVMQNRGVVSNSCIGCCVLLSQNKLLMCHEDLQTNFFRTLGSANLEDVTAILQDSQISSYCILEFESQEDGVSSEQWILYFNSDQEKTKFINKLMYCWKKLFQIELPINKLDSLQLKMKCKRRVEQLTEHFSLLSS
ncbi:Hypothetical predicted protein [Octopus vulgaris]|uniref:Pleckstrin homology domain-containing family M member 2 n=1 Tax=Octopus vulgaris TaxID=6645 RepID=A0AA36BU24_OCTVU|nr:Hypothetical predicted protein [Octopus vulgaris]